MLGYFPDFRTHLIWWILVGASIGSAVLIKKNVYCGYMCPYHAVQKGLISISGMKFRLSPKIQKRAKHTSKVLIWASLMLIFISANPTLAAYEPFAMFFSLEGIGIQWYILPATLVGSLFINNFFCTYFCPVGRSFTYMIKARKSVDILVSKIKTIWLWKNRKSNNNLYLPFFIWLHQQVFLHFCGKQFRCFKKEKLSYFYLLPFN